MLLSFPMWARVALLFLFTVVHIFIPARSTRVLSLSVVRPPPFCEPMREPARGTWAHLGGGRFSWTRADHCRFAIDSRESFLETFAGRRLIFVGDSQVREFLYDSIAFFANCCEAQLEKPCNQAAVRDPRTCTQLEPRVAYPVGPVEYNVLVGDGRNVSLVLVWTAYPEEALDAARPGSSTWFLPFLEGRERADGVLLTFGHWNLIFDSPTYYTKRIDSAVGLANLEAEAAKVGDALAKAEAARPGLLRTLVWMRMPPDEIDVWPHPNHHKRMIQPQYREGAIAACTNLIARHAATEWILTDMLDVRAGNVTRPFNQNFLTYDGMHYGFDINVNMGWELWSWWAKHLTHF